MFQTGSPASASTKTSTSIWNEPFEDEIRPALRHNARGIVSMANKGANTNGSQFFVCFAAAPHLDGVSTVFGKAIGGLDVLDKIEAVEVDGKHRPKEKMIIKNSVKPDESIGADEKISLAKDGVGRVGPSKLVRGGYRREYEDVERSAI